MFIPTVRRLFGIILDSEKKKRRKYEKTFSPLPLERRYESSFILTIRLPMLCYIEKIHEKFLKKNLGNLGKV